MAITVSLRVRMMRLFRPRRPRQPILWGAEAITEYKEFTGRSHLTIDQDGWEEVADYALGWPVEHEGAA